MIEVLHALLSRDSPEQREALIEFLPDSLAHRLNRLPSYPTPVEFEDLDHEDLLSIVHWSWFIPALKSYSPEDQALFLSALPSSSLTPLAKELSCKIPTQKLSPLGRSYLRHVLLVSLIGEHDRVLPKNLLPLSPLNQLLSLTKKQLTLLIDLLSMHDLAGELKQIVETKLLKKIDGCLTEMERKLLKQASVKPEPVNPHTTIGLNRWNGDRDVLKHLLHQKGLARLGIALSMQDPSLIWMVAHQLDLGRGTLLLKYCNQKSSRAMIDTATKQVTELLMHG